MKMRRQKEKEGEGERTLNNNKLNRLAASHQCLWSNRIQHQSLPTDDLNIS